MCKLGCLLLLWAMCGAVVSSEKQDDFVQPLDFAPLFDSGVTSLASNPLATTVLKVDKNQYPKLFDTIVSSSIDSLHTRVAPRENVFSAESFGFNPIASQSFLPPGRPAQLVAQPRPQQNQQTQAVPIGQQLQPLRYDIHTVHDANYKIYKPEEEREGEDILAALKKNPTVAAYFKPAETSVEVAHPLNYRREELIENPDIEQNYKPNAYITGHSRIRRYTSGRQRANLKKSNEEDDDPYNYKVEYISKPKAFDTDLYSSAYKQAKDPNKEYEYPYGGYDSGYDHKEYERIKSLSEKQAAEIKQNPGNCKEVQRDGMTCTTCKDPKTGGNFESCSYVAEPKNNKYAYSKERKFDSNDEPEEVEGSHQAEPAQKSEKYQQADDSTEQKYAKLTSAEPHKDDDSSEKYKSYYVHSSKPKTSESLRAADGKQSSEEENGSLSGKSYDYKKALPGFYTDNEPKKDVENVLAEFKKKDRSSCKKVQKNGMTCYQCLDQNGLKNEECMFVSESAPKRSHLAYQELKEFTSKPATLEKNNEGAESQTVTTSAPLAAATEQKSAAYVVDTNNYGKKLKRKKASQSIATAATIPVAKAVKPAPATTNSRKTKRSPESDAEKKAVIIDETNIAPPEEFAGSDSKGAFWAETMPRYSPSLGVTLPEYMLSRSEHEVSFDETVAGA